jgi:DNA-binding response OmpR family regulator
MRVLVVDDYRPLARMLAAVLCNRGYHVRAAYSAGQALRAMEEFRPQAVVLDVILGDAPGVEFAAKFPERFPSCRVLLMSARDFELNPAQELAGAKVVRKVALMDELLPFVESCRASQQVEVIESRGEGLAL